MNLFLLLLFLSNHSLLARDLEGTYYLTRATCSDGKPLKLGGPFINVGIKLEIGAAQNDGNSQIQQTSQAQSVSFASFKLTCTIVNIGKIRYRDSSSYVGYLAPNFCECSNFIMQQKICARQMGAEAEGVTEYWWEAEELAIKNLATKNTYSCKDGAVPVYYYRE